MKKDELYGNISSSFFMHKSMRFPHVGIEVYMYSTVMTSMISGIEAIPVKVEVDISTGMPAFDMVGYLSSEVKEARERVRTALHNCGFCLPAKRITINLSPANIRKSGTGFDLPIAIALLIAMEEIPVKHTQNMMFTGELNLNGQLLGVSGVLPIVSDGKKAGYGHFVVPAANLAEGRLVEQAEVLGFDKLMDVIHFLQTTEYEDPEFLMADMQKTTLEVDFAEVNGQAFLKRAAEIAASGMHNMLMVGPPGSGKTMISERMATILPPLAKDEQLEVSKIYSICGLLSNHQTLIEKRPFRNPHHTITKAGLAGGGIFPKPGEISLAHNGVLFLDELTEFDKTAIEILRQPLEEREIRLTRARGNICYPADFLMLASMNPCNCGYYPNMQKCRCTQASLKRHFDKISQPLIDRMDLCVEAPMVSFAELMKKGKNESSAQIQGRVNACHQIQMKRFAQEKFHHNSRIPASRLSEFCSLGKTEKTYMEKIYAKMSLTARTYHKILRIARTIADMREADTIGITDLQEAVCYRSIDEKFWGGV